VILPFFVQIAIVQFTEPSHSCLSRSFDHTFKQAVRRMKLRYREILPSEIASTVDSVNEVDDELRQLMRILSDS
jgi:hypothetical protein